METLLVVLIVLISIVLIGIVLIQNPKGGGMSSNIAGGNQMFGVKKTTDILEKGTWYLIIALVVCTLFLNVNMQPKQAAPQETIISGAEGEGDVPPPAPAPAPTAE